MTMRDYKLVCPTYNMLLNGRPCEKCKNRKYYECFLNKCTKNSYLKSFLNMSEMYFHHSFLNIYQLIDIFISPSFFLKSKCEEMGFKAKIKFLPNFVNLNEYAPSYVHDEKMIIYFGRISPEKGISTLIRAMKGLSIKLKIIGDGPWVDSLRVSIKNLNLENVNFLGYKTGEDLKGEIAKSMFSVIPSEWYENNPRSVLESFALGKAVVGSRIGGIPELIQEGKTGLTFEPGNVEELKAKIKYLAENSQKSLEMGKAGRVFLEEKLSSETHYQRLMDIYREATQV
jgi:glycosyltransferase involved in cell wall biosynthesis